MIDRPDSDVLLERARALAARGEWAGVRALVAQTASLATTPALALVAAEAEMHLGAPRAAFALVSEVIPALHRSRNGADLRRALNLAGVAQVQLGDLDGAKRDLDAALEHAHADGDDLLVARVTNNLGTIANIRGRRDEALALYQLAIPAYQRTGNTNGIAQSYHNMAHSYRDLQRFETAEELEFRAMEMAREAGNVRLAAMARAGRAELHLMRGDVRMADVGARRAALEFSRLPDPVGEADATRLAGLARAELGDHAAALADFARAIRLARSVGALLQEAETLEARARLHATLGDAHSARNDADAAAATFERMGAAEDAARARELGREMPGGHR
jgi:tetratricopeptide (TPR) repeat protein